MDKPEANSKQTEGLLTCGQDMSTWRPITENKINFINAMDADQRIHSTASFQDAVSSGKTLGKQDEVALEIQMRDWLCNKDKLAPVNANRGTALLADALGEFRLESGTRLDRHSHADTKDRILKTSNYDFGGEAESFLRMSAGALVESQNYVDAHKGTTEGGQVLDESYKRQLQEEQKSVESRLDTIYGAHDIPSIFDELKQQFRQNPEDLEKAMVRIDYTEELPSSDTRMKAKEDRDLALGYLAAASHFAEIKGAVDAGILYNDAVKRLHKAEELASDAPDNQALEKLQHAVAKEIPEVVDDARHR